MARQMRREGHARRPKYRQTEKRESVEARERRRRRKRIISQSARRNQEERAGARESRKPGRADRKWRAREVGRP